MWHIKVDINLIGDRCLYEQILAELRQIKGGQRIMAVTIDDILAKAKVNETVGGSTIALLQALKAKIDAIPPNDPNHQAKLDELFQVLTNDQQKLEDAIVANTPAE